MNWVGNFGLLVLGVVTGSVAGLLGIGGGLLMVPVLIAFGVSPLQATATSLVCVLLSSLSGSWRNWRDRQLNLSASAGLAVGGIPTAPLGAQVGSWLPGGWLALGFALLQILAIYFMGLRHKLSRQEAIDNRDVRTAPNFVDPDSAVQSPRFPLPKTIGIGLLAGLLSGLFGVGGGVVMVPLQMLLLAVPIKTAVRTSLGAIVAISASGLIQHTWNGNVLWIYGVCLGLGGILGAQFGTRALPKLPESWVNRLFRVLLLALSAYMVVRGIQQLGWF